MANEIDKTEFFKVAAGYAKTIAKDRSDSEITPLTFLAGLVMAAVAADEGEDAQFIADNSDAIKIALNTRDLALPENAIEPLDEKMPLSAELKEALNANRKDIRKFLHALLNIAAPVRLSDNPLASINSYYLADYLDAEGGVVCGDAFAAAAFSAFENGEFRDYPGLSSFFSANRSYLTALVNKVFDGKRSVKRDDPREFKLCPELENALRTQDDGHSSRFVAAIDFGLATGVNIISDRITAYHEAGHAIVHSVLRPEIPVNRVMVKREKGYLGVTVYDGSAPQRNLFRREDYLVELCVCLAGQMAQAIKFGDGFMDEGVSSDIEKATKRAWNSIAYYGLDPDFGPVDLSIFKESSGFLFDEAQKRLQVVMKEAAGRTEKILRENWLRLETVAVALIATGDIDFEQFVSGLTLNGLQQVPGVMMATSVPVTRTVTFSKAPGSHQTPEGAVRYESGDAIVTGDDGDSWPISRGTFEELYEVESGGVFGFEGSYVKKPRQVLALPLRESSRVDMSGGRGVLLGQGGDWIVDYGHGDMAIVSGNAFEKFYRLPV
ncbi:MAG: PGDYG domain-containing protein [Sphingomonadales bacterium]|jgi:hypothetical protein